MDFYWAWLQDHFLAIVAIALTLVFFYHYLMERDTGVKLSKRYRNSIFEAQSKIFLNATQYLISGNKDLAIREFLNAVDINRETVDTYFALGGLFRSNGEIEKAISIHRSLIARENISESSRLKALKELAVDFDKGGFVEKAIETYHDVLKINRDQQEVVQSLCRIYEDIEDWDEAYKHRMMLSKVSQESQAETISHIMVQKAKVFFEKGDFTKCSEELQDAFRFAPSVSAKILWLRLSLANGDFDRAKHLLLELLNEHPVYTSFVFESLEEKFNSDEKTSADYKTRVGMLRDFFMSLNDKELLNSPSVVLAKVRILKQSRRIEEAYNTLTSWIENHPESSQVLRAEYIKILILLERKEEVITQVQILVGNIDHTHSKHFCQQCGFNSDSIFWRCPQCHEWETIQFRWKV